MRAHEFILLEYNRETTINSLGTKMLKYYYSSKYGNNVPEELLNDPTNRKKVLDEILSILESFKVPGVPDNYFTVWLAREYSRGNLTHNAATDDLTYLNYSFIVMKPQLEAYYKYKNKPWFPRELKDIMRLDFKTFYYGMRDLKVPEEVTKDRGNSVTVLDTPDVRIIHLLDKQAAIYYGQGTHPRWCTSYTDSDNRFNSYASTGELYVILPKKPDHKNEKYQFYFNNGGMVSSDEYTDETNTQINPAHLIEKFGEDFKQWLSDIRPQFSESIMLQDTEKITKLWVALSNYLKPEFDKYVESMNDESQYDPERSQLMGKIAMKLWTELSKLKGDVIKSYCRELYNGNKDLYEMRDMYSVWDLVYEENNDHHYNIIVPLTKVLDINPVIEKVGSNYYRKNLQRVFYKDIEVDGYYIGTLGGHIR